jgi:hypothetical protein
VAIGLDAIGIDVHDQAADFAAGSFADRHGGRGVGRHPVARPHGDCKDCVAPLGAPTGNAARPDPCCRWGVGHGAVQPTPLPWTLLDPPQCWCPIGLVRRD